MQLEKIIQQRLVELIAKADAILRARTSSDFRGRAIYHVSKAEVAGWSTSVLSLLQKTFTESGSHFQSFQAAYKNFNGYESEFTPLAAILAAAKEDFEGGYLFNLTGLAKAEVLGDALEQARSFLKSGFKDAACVVIGVALETTLKEISLHHSLPIASLEDMNVALRKNDIYNLTKQQQVTAWIALRNKGAHGAWTAYSAADISDMHSGVNRFVGELLCREITE